MPKLMNKVFRLSFLSFLLYPLSFVNQLIISHFFGTSVELDIYWLLLSIVNIILFIEIPLKEGLVPEFIRNYNVSKRKGSIFLYQHLTFVIILVSVLVVIFFLFNKSLMGYLIPDNVSYSTEKIFYYLPFLLPIIFFRIFSQTINGILISLEFPYFNYFLSYAISLLTIFFVYFFAVKYGIIALLAGMGLGYFLIFLMEIFALSKKGISNYSLIPKFSKPVRDLTFFISGGMGISNLLFLYQRHVFLYLIPGAVSAFQYSQALIFLPINFLAYPITSIITPKVLENIKSNSHIANYELLKTWGKRIIILLGLFSFLCWIFSIEVVYIIYSRGKFNLKSLQLVSQMIKLISIAIPFIVIFDLINKFLTLYEDKKKYFFLSLVNSLSNFIFIYLGYIYNNIEIAVLGYSFCMLFTVFIGYLILIKMFAHPEIPLFSFLNKLIDGEFILNTARWFFCFIILVLTSYIMSNLISDNAIEKIILNNKFFLFGKVVLFSSIFAGIYFSIIYFFKIITNTDIRNIKILFIQNNPFRAR